MKNSFYFGTLRESCASPGEYHGFQCLRYRLGRVETCNLITCPKKFLENSQEHLRNCCHDFLLFCNPPSSSLAVHSLGHVKSCHPSTSFTAFIINLQPHAQFKGTSSATQPGQSSRLSTSFNNHLTAPVYLPACRQDPEAARDVKMFHNRIWLIYEC